MVANDEEMRQAAARTAAMQAMGLTVLLARAGGAATVTEAEYEEILARFGGKTNMAIHIEAVGSAGGPAEVQLTLVRKPPANADLVS